MGMCEVRSSAGAAPSPAHMNGHPFTFAMLLVQARELGEEVRGRRKRTVAAMIGRARLTPDQADALMAGTAAVGSGRRGWVAAIMWAGCLGSGACREIGPGVEGGRALVHASGQGGCAPEH